MTAAAGDARGRRTASSGDLMRISSPSISTRPPVTLLVVLGPARDRASLGRHDGLPLSVDDPGGVVTGLGRWTMTADEGNDLLSQ